MNLSAFALLDLNNFIINFHKNNISNLISFKPKLDYIQEFSITVPINQQNLEKEFAFEELYLMTMREDIFISLSYSVPPKLYSGIDFLKNNLTINYLPIQLPILKRIQNESQLSSSGLSN